MNKTEKLNLIEGNFSHEEARDILINIFSSKINFHELKNFSSNERVGKDCETAKKRIPELKSEIKRLEQILSEAKEKNKKLIISSEINISLSDE
ncbi:MAG: hypothetical protein POELPBGB_03486 [Bacteroidia bacterium]|nr:hypothetical protein [Bacteroidia bacterium]